MQGSTTLYSNEWPKLHYFLCLYLLFAMKLLYQQRVMDVHLVITDIISRTTAGRQTAVDMLKVCKLHELQVP